MRFRLNGWQRIGIALSVLWCIGWGSYFWFKFTNEVDAIYRAELQACYRDEYHARAQGGTEKCLTAAEVNGGDLYTNHAWLEMVPIFCAATLTFAWLFAWGATATVRWIARGFR